MTDDQTLCRKIAEAERWTEIEMEGRTCATQEYWGLPTKDSIRQPIPRYLADPAEMVRMLEALIEYYNERVEFSTNSLAGMALECERYDHAEGKIIEHISIQGAESPGNATAEAYKAMLLAKKGETV